MTFRVEVTESAKRDLQEIYDYIAYSLKSPMEALKQSLAQAGVKHD